MTTLNIIDQKVDALKPNDRNPRTHSARQIKQISRSIEEFGFTSPILVDNSNIIIAGHGRLKAAKKLGMTVVPTIQLAELSQAQVRAYIIADNRLAELAEWNCDILATEFQTLLELDLDFDVTLTGFEMPEIDLLIEGLTDDGSQEEEIPALKSEAQAITQPCDIWQIGPHRLICADALEEETWTGLLEGEKAEMVFTDPPYNVCIEGNVSGKGLACHGEFAMASGEMTKHEFVRFLSTVFERMAVHSIDGSIHYICMDWRHMTELLAAGRNAYSELKNLCVWAKTNGGMGSLYRSQHELVFVFKSGTERHINNVHLGT